MADQPHILVISETGQHDDLDCARFYEVECPGVTDACRLWWPCSTCQAPDFDLPEDDSVAHPVVHGVEHRMIEDNWMTATGQCYVAEHDHLHEAGDELGLPIGRHPVEFDSGDGCDLSLISLVPA